MHETRFVTSRPLVGIALCVVLGMLLGSTGLLTAGVLLCAAFFSLLLALALIRTKSSRWAVFGCVVLVSAARFMVTSSFLSDVEINRMLPQLPARDARLSGHIAATPDFYAYPSGSHGTWVFPFECEGIKETDSWRRCRGRIQIRIANAASDLDFNVGQRMRFSGNLRQRDFPGNEAIELNVARDDGWRMLENAPRFSPIAMGQRLRGKGAQTLTNGIEEHADQLAVYKALLLGYRKAVPPEIYSRFTQTGTVHIFAISGLHVGMVGLFITIMLKALGVPRDKWGIWLLPLLLLYVCSTGMKSSALRAWTMAAVYFLAPLFRRKPDVPTAVAFAAILLLWLNPSEILSAGFIFSFTVVSFLVMAFSAIPRQWVVGGEGLLRRVRTYVASLGITSAAAFVASVPLTALFFGNFSPVSLLGNLIVVPLTFCIVLTGWLSMLVPLASGILNHAAVVFINGLLGSVELLAQLPGAHGPVPPPSLWAVLFWYVGWVGLLVHARTLPHRIRALGWVALAVVWMVALQTLT